VGKGAHLEVAPEHSWFVCAPCPRVPGRCSYLPDTWAHRSERVFARL